jgi:hypothetical protein
MGIRAVGTGAVPGQVRGGHDGFSQGLFYLRRRLRGRDV